MVNPPRMMGEESSPQFLTPLPNIGAVYVAHKRERIEDWLTGMSHCEMMRIRTAVKNGNGPLRGRCLKPVIAVACRLEEAGITGPSHITTLLDFFHFVFRSMYHNLEEAWDDYFVRFSQSISCCSALTLVQNDCGYGKPPTAAVATLPRPRRVDGV
ncbi:hypothetical protein BJY01DRAFT_228293 [Aspergillus pseudoustus]|uniref:Uncharacterized protein n=1 Tax=Aspergillus pseudoustus TaxID=1810923 RepID=A0ABR4ILE7_9EURO